MGTFSTLAEQPLFQYSVMSLMDMNSLGISDGLYSPFNVTAKFKGRIMGYILTEKRPLNINHRKDTSQELMDYASILTSKEWYLIRKICFQEDYRYSGNLENMFDFLIDVLPQDCDLWCNIYWDRKTKYIEQIGGFAEIHNDICKNDNIRIYSVYQRKNE